MFCAYSDNIDLVHHGTLGDDANYHLFFIFIVIVAFLENATIGYSLKSVCVCPCLCVCVYFCTITQKEIDLGT